VRATLKEAYKLFHDGSLALAEMEHNGIRIDTEYLDSISRETGERIASLSTKLKAHEIAQLWRRSYASDRLNMSSRVQLAEVLFLPKGKGTQPLAKYPWGNQVTKSGRMRTDEETLRKVNLPFVNDWLEWYQIKDFKKKYLDGLKEETVDGYVHPFFHLTSSGKDDEKGGARSYRSSSSAINIQNQLNRVEEWAQKIRRCFIAREGRRVIFRDMAGHEFRIASSIWEDPEMIRYASDPTLDIHRDTASEMLLCKKKQVTKLVRHNVGKNGFVFPHLYGSWWKEVARKVWLKLPTLELTDGTSCLDHLRSKGITELGNCNTKLREEPKQGTFEHVVRQVERDFDAKFSTFRKHADEFYQDYRRNAGFPLVTGFWCDGLYSKNQVLNTPVQGPSFHIVLWSCIEINKELKRKKMKRTCTVAEIHDEVISDTHDNEVQDYMNLSERIMTKDVVKAMPWITCPLATEASVTPIEGAWSEKEPWVEVDGIWAPKNSR